MLDADARAVASAIAGAAGPLPPPTDRRAAPPPARIAACILEAHGAYDAMVRRFRAECPAVRTCAELRALLARRGGPRAFLLRVFHLRDARRARVLAQTLEYLDEVQSRCAGRSEAQRLARWAWAKRPGDYFSLGIDGLGLREFQRLRARLGANAAVPDDRVTRYLAYVLHRPVSKVQGLYLLERAAQVGGFDVRDIDERLGVAGVI